MKGFPNQIADFAKLAKGMKVALDLVEAGENAKQNSTFGEALAALIRDDVVLGEDQSLAAAGV